MKLTKVLGVCLLIVFVFLSACQGAGPTASESPTTPAATSTPPPQTAPIEQPTSIPQPVVDYPGIGWWNDVTFYEIFVRSFKDSDGDGVGDFQGIISQLDYLNDGDPNTSTDLGIGGLWLMPIFPSPSYHGYDVSDYMSVNPDYGTIADFKQLLEECHQRGIHVIIDLVINHTSSDHPWFQAAVDGNAGYHDWYVWSKTKPTNTSGPWGNNAWYEASNGEYYYAPFTKEMPDLNYHNPMVTKAMDNVTSFWLNLGVDGFRVDAARYLFEESPALQDTKSTITWFQEWRKYYKNINPEAFTVGEVWTDLQITAKYNEPTKGMDSLFMFDLAADVLGGVYSPDPSRVIKAYQDALTYFPDGTFSTFLTNHDQQRVASFFSDKLSKQKIAAFTYLTGPGIPFIYYGEEIGMTGGKPDPNIRTPMQWNEEKNSGFTSGKPWMAVNANFPQKNVELLTNNPDSLLSWYRTLVNLRANTPELRLGEYLPLISSCRSVYAVLRTLPDSTPVLAVINLAVTKAENCTISLEASPAQAGDYNVQDLWGISHLEAVTIATGGGIPEFPLSTTLEGGESFIVRLINK
ncbi:MAG TPA: alpha-amylase family glycosyl hydrolase [Anaerolineaceae bacterium]|nr:alpha-amylase family glycosyl hydrolase [Anaerolineaceae bacterium]